jgi:hypothetical protein
MLRTEGALSSPELTNETKKPFSCAIQGVPEKARICCTGRLFFHTDLPEALSTGGGSAGAARQQFSAQSLLKLNWPSSRTDESLESVRRWIEHVLQFRHCDLFNRSPDQALHPCGG